MGISYQCISLFGNTNLSISEHLTDNTFNILSSAQSTFGIENVWVHKTLVHAIVDGNRYTLKTLRDLEKVKSTTMNQAVTNTDPELTTTNVLPTNDDPPLNHANKQTQHKHANSEYLRLLNEKNQAVLAFPPRPRGYPSNNGRGRERRHINLPRRFRSNSPYLNNTPG